MTDTIYVGEVFVDADGNYIGVNGAWAHATASVFTGVIPPPPGPISLAQAFADYWDDPSDHVLEANNIAPLFFELPALDAAASVVPINDGPPGLEDKPALVVAASGAPSNIATWMGPTGNAEFGDTGWTPENNSVWCMSGWVRAYGFEDVGGVPPGLNLGCRLSTGRYRYTEGGAAVFKGSQNVTLTGEWQFINFRFRWIWGTASAMPLIVLSGDGWVYRTTKAYHVNPDPGDLFTFTKYDDPGKGVYVKEPHLWTCQLIKPGYHTHKVAATVPT